MRSVPIGSCVWTFDGVVGRLKNLQEWSLVGGNKSLRAALGVHSLALLLALVPCFLCVQEL